MARPKKAGLDYFPKDVNFYSDRKIRRILAKHGMEGLIVYDYMLCLIYSEDGYFIERDNDLSFDISDALNYKVDESFVDEVINTCLKVNLFNKKVFDQQNKLTSKGIQERYLSAKRTAEISYELNLIPESKSQKQSLKTPDKKDQNPKNIEPQKKHERPEHAKDKYQETINKDDLRAFEFAQQQKPTKFEQRFKMKHWAKIKDKQRFKDYFNDMVDEKGMDYDPDKLIGGLSRLATTWVKNQSKYDDQNQSQTKQTSKIPIK